MKFRHLKTELELERYRRMTESQIGVLFPIEYLKKSKVFALYDNFGHVRGGFAIVRSGPFRVIESIPEEFAPEDEYTCKRMAEITALWLDAPIRRAYSAKLWVKIFRELIFSRKTRFVYAYTMKKSHLKKTYSIGRPKILFRGITKMLPGMEAPDKESVEIISLINVIFCPFVQPGFFLRRFRKAFRYHRIETPTTPKIHDVTPYFSENKSI